MDKINKIDWGFLFEESIRSFPFAQPPYHNLLFTTGSCEAVATRKLYEEKKQPSFISEWETSLKSARTPLPSAIRVPKPIKSIKELNQELLNSIDHVIYNPPATIVFWSDGTKTVVKAQNDEPFDSEKGLAMAFIKKAFYNCASYNELFKKFC